MSKLIFIDRLEGGYANVFLSLSKKAEDLTHGLEYPELKTCILGSHKKVKAWFYPGKPDLYKSRKAAPGTPPGADLLVQYQKKLDLTLLGFIKYD